jgi:hypothetical protein
MDQKPKSTNYFCHMWATLRAHIVTAGLPCELESSHLAYPARSHRHIWVTRGGRFVTSGLPGEEESRHHVKLVSRSTPESPTLERDQTSPNEILSPPSLFTPPGRSHTRPTL